MDLAYMAALPPMEFVERRQRLLALMPDNSALLLFSAEEKIRNRDCEYPFRQDSYFGYLTGFNEPNAALLLVKQAGEGHTSLFLRPRDPEQETWTGKRLGVAAAPKRLFLDSAFKINDLDAVLGKTLENLGAFFYCPQHQIWGNALLSEQINIELAQDWQPWLDEMRLIKSNNEIRLMQQAAQISAFGHIRAMQQTYPNRMEYEIEAELLHEFARFGARFAAYNSIVASGENACILHYTENDQVLRNGDLLLIDAGCEFAMYAGDITRTFPINGCFSAPQREIYELVLQAQKQAIALLTIGTTLGEVEQEVIRIITAGLLTLGILQGELNQLIEQKAYRAFYMHGLGHWLGLDVHDVGNYGENKNRPLQEGMVLTVEPGIYISPEADVPPQYKGIGVRIEDNILITEYGNKILTAAVPKEIIEIENLMNSHKRS